MFSFPHLHHTLILHCPLKDDILYIFEHILQMIGICGTCKMGIDLFVSLMSACGLILLLDEIGSFLKIASTIIFWEGNTQISFFNFLLKKVHLVQEEDNRCITEPTTVTNLIEQEQALIHTVGCVILVALLVIFTQTADKDDCSDTLEAVNPLLSLISLTVVIVDEQMEGKTSKSSE